MSELKRRRRELGMTQCAAAAAIGISQPHLSRLERGAADFSALRSAVERRIAEVFGIPADLFHNDRRNIAA